MPDRFAAVDAVPMPPLHEIERAIREAPGVVYFAQFGDNGPIKIGYAARGKLRPRLSVLQTGCPAELHLRRTMPATRATERGLHRFFADLRIRGEWFWPDQDLADFADAIADPL